MAACEKVNSCLFYNKYKTYPPAKQAFIETACAGYYPCARKVWSQTNGGKEPPVDMAPSGFTIEKKK